MLFKQVIGQKEIKSRLVNAVKEDRISHAQLFLGKPGTGNLALALAYAQYIMCENKTGEDSCGVCDSCVKHNKLIHPDLHFIFPTANTDKAKGKPLSDLFLTEWRELVLENNAYFTLNQLQDKLDTENKSLLIPERESTEIIKKLSLKSYESEYKIVVVWMPEKFNNESANKLLKILEEPEPKTLFLMVAQDSGQIIPTLLSRTQVLKISPIDEKSLSESLMNQFQLSEQQASQIASQSDGDFLEAKSCVETSETEKQFYSLFTEWMRSAFKADVISLIQFSEEISKLGREKQKQFIQYCLHLIRESLINNYGTENLNKSSNNEKQFLVNFAPFIHGENCINAIELFENAHYHIERNGNSKIIFLDISLKFTKLLRVKNSYVE